MNNFLEINSGSPSNAKSSAYTQQNSHLRKSKQSPYNESNGGYVLTNQPSEIQEVSSYQEDDDPSNVKISHIES
jgi:hypothetical protein